MAYPKPEYVQYPKNWRYLDWLKSLSSRIFGGLKFLCSFVLLNPAEEPVDYTELESACVFNTSTTRSTNSFGVNGLFNTAEQPNFAAKRISASPIRAVQATIGIWRSCCFSS